MRNKETYYHILSTPAGIQDLPQGILGTDAVNVDQLNDAIGDIDLSQYYNKTESDSRYIFASPNTPQNKFIDLLGTVTVRDINGESSSMSATQFETSNIFSNNITSDTSVATTNLTNIPSIGSLTVSSSSALNLIGTSDVALDGGNLKIRNTIIPKTNDNVQFLVRNVELSPDTYYQDVQTIAFADMPFASASPSGDYIYASPDNPQDDFINVSGGITTGSNVAVNNDIYMLSNSSSIYMKPPSASNVPVLTLAGTNELFLGDINGALDRVNFRYKSGNNALEYSTSTGKIIFNETPTLDTLPTQVLTRDSVTGEVKYVPSTSFGGGGSSYTFNNGLTESSGVVKLGGSIDFVTNPYGYATIIGEEDKTNLSFGNIYNQTRLHGTGGLELKSGYVDFDGITVSPMGSGIFFPPNSTQGKITIKDSTGSLGEGFGLYYDSDYSIGRTFPTDNLWIPNAGWVLSQMSTGYVDLTTTQLIGGFKTFSQAIGTNGIRTTVGSIISMEDNTKINFRDRTAFASGDYSIQQFGTSRLVFNRVGYSGSIPDGSINFDGDAIFDSNVKYFVKSVNGVLADAAGNVVVSGGGGGTVTSVALSAPTGFAVTGSPVTTTGTLALSFASGYSLPSDTTQASWTAKQSQLSGTGFVKATGTTISYDNSTYLTTTSAATSYVDLTTNQTINGDKTFKGLVNIEKGGYLGSFGQGGQGGDSYFKFQGNAKSYDFVIQDSDSALSISDGGTSRFLITSGGNIGIGGATGTARLHLPAGAAGAGLAPLRFTSGTNTTTAVAGQMEYNGTILTFTPTGTTRQTFAYLGLAQTWTAQQSGTTPTAKDNTTKFATTGFVGKQFTATGSGTGAATSITVAHGVSGVTSANSVMVSANNSAAAGISYCTLDATNVTIVYAVAPASGTNNLAYSISIK